MDCQVAIIGAGPAGSAAAITLARREVDVLLLDRRSYPPEKLCGEHLSAGALPLLEELGVLETLRSAGTPEVRQVRITAPSGTGFTAALDPPELSVSRRLLDGTLFEAARRAGATLRDDTLVEGIEDDGGGVEDDRSGGMELRTSRGPVRAKVVLGAWGKRSRLDGRLDRPFVRTSPANVAFQVHARGAVPENRVELHSFRGGYCGLGRVESGAVNVCWIADRHATGSSAGSAESMWRGPMRSNPALAERLSGLEPETGFRAVAAVTLREKTRREGDVWLCGDAAGMVAPLTGAGMTQALASGIEAGRRIHEVVSGQISPGEGLARWANDKRPTSSPTLRQARLLHGVLERPPLIEAAVRLGRWVPALARAAVRASRPPVAPPARNLQSEPSIDQR